MCHGVGNLHIVKGCLNTLAYIDLISPTRKENRESIIGKDFFFQKDGAKLLLVIMVVQPSMGSRGRSRGVQESGPPLS